MRELVVLQAVRLKGRISAADLAATLGEVADGVEQMVGSLEQAGLLTVGKTIRITPEGRQRLGALLTEERLGIDGDAIAAVHDQFRVVNATFKAVVTDWQLKAGQPNDHGDSSYDATVLARLGQVHEQVMPIITTAAREAPRLGRYAAKLDDAMSKINAGDLTWFTSPLIDSYHTVWFELHEELIGLAGLSRQEEAKSGHAQ
jgi:hypothetical protein